MPMVTRKRRSFPFHVSVLRALPSDEGPQYQHLCHVQAFVAICRRYGCYTVDVYVCWDRHSNKTVCSVTSVYAKLRYTYHSHTLSREIRGTACSPTLTQAPESLYGTAVHCGIEIIYHTARQSYITIQGPVILTGFEIWDLWIFSADFAGIVALVTHVGHTLFNTVLLTGWRESIMNKCPIILNVLLRLCLCHNTDEYRRMN